MEKEMEVTCKECDEVFKARFDTKMENQIPMGFCPHCQKMVEVKSKEFTQFSS